MKSARYIVFDGMDGSGKGTQMNLLQDKLRNSVCFTREPGGTPYAEEIRKILLDNPLAGESTALNNFLLFWAAREDLQQKLVVPMLNSGHHVFSDRGDSSTFAFQLHGEEHEDLISAFVFMRKIVFGYPGRRKPDLYIIFDLPAQTARERVMQDANRHTNHFDDREVEYYRRVRHGFQKFAEFAPVEFVDARQTPDGIHQDVLGLLAKQGISLMKW